MLDDWLTFSIPGAPRRVISLVPSITESLFDLGIADSLVGVTDYCIYPEGKLLNLPRVGGVLTPDIQNILSLRPDLIIANQEENSRNVIEQLFGLEIPIWITFPKTVQDVLAMLWRMVGIFQSDEAGYRLRSLQMLFDYVQESTQNYRPWKYFCPIWQEGINESPWFMTFNKNTYMDSLLSIFGGVNAFAERQRLYLLMADLGDEHADDSIGRDIRSQRVILDEVLTVNPEVIILPTEPYPYTEHDIVVIRNLLQSSSAAESDQIHLLDGTYLTWYGTRLSLALQYLPTIFST